MILGSFPFLVIAQTNIKNPFAAFKDHQVKIFILILFLSIVLIFFFAQDYLSGSNTSKIITIFRPDACDFK